LSRAGVEQGQMNRRACLRNPAAVFHQLADVDARQAEQRVDGHVGQELGARRIQISLRGFPRASGLR